MSWRITDAGCMNDPTDMSGCLTASIMNGSPIIMDVGAGILLSAGPGCPMSHGDGAPIITEDGTGDWGWVGTGYRPESGARPGSTGAGAMIISGGVL